MSKAVRAGLAVAAVAFLTACSSSGSSGTSATGQPSTDVTPSASVTGPTSSATSTTKPAGVTCGWLATPPARYQHVIWIWFENKSSGSVVGSPNAPTFNNLGRSCGAATNFHNVSHPSLPNYLAATSGSTNGVDSDCAPESCSSNSRSFFRQLELDGLTWRTFAESMPRNCAAFNDGRYAVKHNPPPYFTDVKATCPRFDVDFTAEFAHELDNNVLPAFSFITPNLCNDMHDCSVRTGDTWLKGVLSAITSSLAYRSGTTAVFVTFDEGTGGSHGENCAAPTNNDESCHIATYVMGPAVQPGTHVETRFTHYSMLRTTEEMLGVTTYLGNAGIATSMRAAFGL
jgi:hypothetical protein